MVKRFKSNQDLSDDEAELYDRQIRLWGVDCQQRLRNANVLLIGMSGVGAEIAKNLVLCGIKKLTIIDHHPLTQEDLSAQFLAQHEIGKNRAAASYERLKALNPRVDIVVDESDFNGKPDEFFTDDTHLVIACGVPYPAMLRIDRLCRSHSVQFFAVDVFGMHGFFFLALHDHVHWQEEVKFLKDGKKKVDTIRKNTVPYPTLEETCEPDMSDPEVKKRLSKMDPTFFLVQTLLKFRTVKGRDLSPASKESDLGTCKSLLEEILTKYELSTDTVSPQMFESAFLQANPVCAVLGATVSQEIIRVIGCSGQPVRNMFFFNPATNSGIVQCTV